MRYKDSFLFKLIRDSWNIAAEHARYMKAMRILSRQEWSVEFLVSLLRQCDKPLTLIIKNGSNEIRVTKDTEVAGAKGAQLAERDLMEYLGMIPEQGL
jgi:hypothetical protein